MSSDTIVLAILIGLIPAAIAHNKGRSFLGGGSLERRSLSLPYRLLFLLSRIIQ